MQEMEECCYLLRKAVADRTGDMGSGVIIVDTCLAGIYLPREWKEYTGTPQAYKPSDALMAYFNGGSPKPLGRAWSGADLILLPFNVKNKHWVALAIDLKEWEVRVYDCDVHTATERQLQTLLMPVTSLIPVVMGAHPDLKVKYADKVPTPFAIRRDKRLPQNKLR